ncbi:GNAT family N-acetyltransferase [Ferrimonas lipolytica]|uniref:GNAT family N-acetyltransferase n=1 Tax=Ferrimonas lipolytica TaxID=2724191 RepID=A0A6H1UI32_9GAMM|nr:GNAT family protein [Ferrimonas lipolytica]QIZ78289.1 GNAT family N-acetyltransferase [Ferrimonas lipolytica]
MIEATQCRLRPLETTDVEVFYHWLQDRDVTRYSVTQFTKPQSKGALIQWLASINEQRNAVSLGIECKHSNRLIGYAGLVGISDINHSAEYFILIGDKQYWGRGIATEVTRMVTQYGFSSLNLHRVELTAFTTNPAAQRAYEKAGFQHEGVLRQSGYRDGAYHDKVMMAALANEWNNDQ